MHIVSSSLSDGKMPKVRKSEDMQVKKEETHTSSSSISFYMEKEGTTVIKMYLQRSAISWAQ